MEKEEEELLRNWADKAQCYQWLHLQAHDKFRKKNMWFTIPVIIISTITGTANFAQDRFGDEYKNTVVMAIGTLNIMAGIITTIYQFLKISEFNESHRVASLSWGKFYRNIKTELSKNPMDRLRSYEMLKMCKEEFDRLIELSPLVPNEVIEKFRKTFKKIENISKPDILGKLEPTTIYQISEEDRLRLEKKFLYGEDYISINSTKLNNIVDSNSCTEKSYISKTLKTNPINPELNNRIIKFRTTFFKMNGRYPNQEEIQRKLKMIYDDDLNDTNLNDTNLNNINLNNINLNNNLGFENIVMNELTNNNNGNNNNNNNDNNVYIEVGGYIDENLDEEIINEDNNSSIQVMNETNDDNISNDNNTNDDNTSDDNTSNDNTSNNNSDTNSHSISVV